MNNSTHTITSERRQRAIDRLLELNTPIHNAVRIVDGLIERGYLKETPTQIALTNRRYDHIDIVTI